MKEATLNQLSVTFEKTRNAMLFALQMFCQINLNKSGSLSSGVTCFTSLWSCNALTALALKYRYADMTAGKRRT